MKPKLLTLATAGMMTIFMAPANAGNGDVFRPTVGGDEHCIAMFGQTEDQAYVREPGMFCYRDGDMLELASRYWPFAVLSQAAYTDDPQRSRSAADVGAEIATCSEAAAADWRLKWKRWDRPKLKEFTSSAADLGLHLEVWSNVPDREVVVVMRGTEFKSFVDWLANFRWVRITRFIPGFSDQYSEISTRFAQLFADELAEEYGDLDVTIFATGHSLGGGLAQHFAYSLAPTTSTGRPVPRVTQVFAFNTSPVTGWSSVKDKTIRNANAEHLHIHRIFEHGEVLAYPRRAINYIVAPRAERPAIWEIRFNFMSGLNIIESHSMAKLSCSLIKTAYKDPASVDVP